jgi:hypothetical protein
VEGGDGERNVREEGDDFFIVHSAKDGAFRDFEAVRVEDGEDGARFGWVDVLEAVPCCSSRTCLCFSVAYDAAHDEVWVVHDGTKGSTEGVPELTAFVDCAGCFGIDMARGTLISWWKDVERKTWDLGKPPGTLKRVMSFWRPVRSRVYSGRKVLRESSIQRQERMAGAPWPYVKCQI